MASFFNYDNPVWRFVGKFFDLMILNLLWVICSLPIVTIGASTTAVYYVTLKLVRDEEGSTIKSFFKSFKENLKQSTKIWLMLVVAGAIIGFDLYIFLWMDTTAAILRTVMIAVFGGFMIIYLSVFLFVFPLQAKFYNSVKQTLLNAFFMSTRYFLRTLGMLIVDIGLLLVGVFLLPVLHPLFFLFGFPLFAFINSFVFVGIFDQYTEKQDKR